MTKQVLVAYISSSIGEVDKAATETLLTRKFPGIEHIIIPTDGPSKIEMVQYDLPEEIETKKEKTILHG